MASARWWQKLLLAVVSPLAAVVLAEGVVRTLGIDTELARNRNFDIAVPVWLLSDPGWVRNQYDRLQQPKGVRAIDVAWLENFEEARYIQYKLKPHIDVQAVNPFNDIEVRKGITFRITSNAAGFRAREFTPKRKGALRVVALGDSSTFGWGVDPDYTWTNLLERRLTAHGVDVEVFNLGMSGFTSRHGIGVLRHYVRRLEPDLLILGFGANDGRLVVEPVDTVLALDETRLGALRWTLLQLKSVQLLRRGIYSVYDPFKHTVPPAGQPRASRVKAVPPDQYRGNLETLIAEGKAMGAAAVLLSVCVPDDYAAITRAVAARSGLALVDAKEVFGSNLGRIQAGALYPEEAAYQRSIYGDDVMAAKPWLFVTSDGCHPHRTGTSLLADALTAAVEKTVPRRARP